jgi:hypothetical protein
MFTINRLVGWCPTMPLQPRHGYAADFPRGLLVEGSNSTSELPTWVGTRCYPTRVRQVRGWRLDLRGFDGGSLRTPFHLACRAQAVWQCRPSRRCQGCSRPSSCFRGQAALSFPQAATTA